MLLRHDKGIKRFSLVRSPLFQLYVWKRKDGDMEERNSNIRYTLIRSLITKKKFLRHRNTLHLVRLTELFTPP